MLDNYINRKRDNICSIQDITSENNKQQLLLSNRNQTILEEDEEEFFQLYITPYSEKSNQQSKFRDFSVNQDTTIIKGNTHREETLQNKCQEYQKEIARLKKIIIKKNGVIGDLTEELKIYYQHSHKQESKRSSRMNNTERQQCSNQKCRNEMNFLERNNLELYEELQTHKLKFQELTSELTKINHENNALSIKIEKLQKQNGMLRQQNTQLLKSTKKYLIEGNKQIKIISKMRQVLAEKLSLKDMNLHVPEYNPKSSTGKANNQRKTQLKKPINQKGSRPKSVQRHENKQNRMKQRSYSHQTKKYL